MKVTVPPPSAAMLSKRVRGSRDSIGIVGGAASGLNTGWSFVIDISDVSLFLKRIEWP
jgi:hypothetical protein